MLYSPLCIPKVIFLQQPSPWLSVISADSSVSASDALQAFLFLPCSRHWKFFLRTQAATICSLLQELFHSCRRLHWTVWAGNIPLTHGLPLSPTALTVREDNLFSNSSQEVEVICNQLKWILPITEF